MEHIMEVLTLHTSRNWRLFWLRDESLEDSANLPSPGMLALEIVEDLKAALAQFEAIEEDLSTEE
jgi:type I restriction enzyme M protein